MKKVFNFLVNLVKNSINYVKMQIQNYKTASFIRIGKFRIYPLYEKINFEFRKFGFLINKIETDYLLFNLLYDRLNKIFVFYFLFFGIRIERDKNE